MRLPNATGEWNWLSLSSKVPVEDIKLHPDLPWSRHDLSMNNEMTVEAMNYLNQVMTNATDEWNWRSLSSKVPIGDVRLHPDLPWNREGLSWNNEMTVEAMNYLDQVMTNAIGGWEWYDLSRFIPMDEIRLHPDLPWNREGLSWNNEITVEAVNYLDKVMTNAVGEWNWWHLSMNVPMDEIRLHTDLPWDRDGLSNNNEMTVEAMNYLNQVMTKDVGEWDCWALSRVIPMEDIRAHPNLPWDKWMLNVNPGVTVDDVVHLGVEGDIDSIVSMEEIKANPLWPWNKKYMSENPRITMEMVLANPDD